MWGGRDQNKIKTNTETTNHSLRIVVVTISDIRHFKTYSFVLMGGVCIYIYIGCSPTLMPILGVAKGRASKGGVSRSTDRVRPVPPPIQKWKCMFVLFEKSVLRNPKHHSHTCGGNQKHKCSSHGYNQPQTSTRQGGTTSPIIANRKQFIWI